MSKETKARGELLLSMIIWGSIGLFVRGIDLPTPLIATARAIIGALFVLALMLILRRRPQLKGLGNGWLWLGLSGILLGLNWILLFSAYKHTSIAVATLCYYLAPVLVVLLSPLIFRESLGAKKLLCAFGALLGMVLISGLGSGSAAFASGQFKGVALGIAAACVYAGIVICNKKLKGISGLDRTLVQLSISALLLIPYDLLSRQSGFAALDARGWLLLVLLGIVHTGLSYYLYFDCMDRLPAQTVAVLAYIDPVVAVLLSALLLKEPMDLPMALGAVLVIGSALLLELPTGQKKAAPDRQQL